ncbi:hypothetical protein R1sor_015141 [Riccia sorocarpa]|uniref:Reverse transcriptase domain-containing protein n=1 Tax=Riccia sorocarpa TaxID=122646 RepID=A0ABD3HBE9_9MARC
MCAMGFGTKFIELAQGLVEGSVSKLHMNGTFSEEINIECGVKQGCPLAPLLFAISTQPLMLILRKRESEGSLKGLALADGRMALYNLYADDSGVMLRAEQDNFRALHQAINLYEEISGAKLNIAKSTVIPIALEGTPEWLNSVGCYIAREGEIIRYLGFPIGRNVKQTQCCDYVLGKLQKRLGNWTYRTLTYEGRLVVAKHVLRLVPTHILTCLALNAKALTRLEAICRRFVWGVNTNGQQKIPLIAWEEFLKSKREGGFAFTSFALQGSALRLKHLLRVFEDTEEDWVTAFQCLLQRAVEKRPGGVQRSQWTAPEILLTDCPKKILRAQTASGLLARNTAAEMKLMLGRKRIRTIGAWMDWAWGGNETRSLPRKTQELLDHGLVLEVESRELTQLDWQWRIGNRRLTSWSLSTQTCKKLMRGSPHDPTPLNKIWDRMDTSRRWAKRFTRLWKSFLPAREKSWMWKLLQHGLPTLERAVKWRPEGTATCTRCTSEPENLSHLFWRCSKARRVWSDFAYLAEGLPASPARPADFLAAIDAAFHGNSPAKYVPFVGLLRTIWISRNSEVYSGRQNAPPLVLTLRQILDMASALSYGLSPSSRKHRKLQELVQTIHTMIKRLGDQPTDTPPDLEEEEQSIESLSSSDEGPDPERLSVDPAMASRPPAPQLVPPSVTDRSPACDPPSF